jgi:T-complex protein 1 subunit theta
MDVRSKEQVVKRLKAPVASKQFGQEEILSSLVADVIINCIPSIVFVTN